MHRDVFDWFDELERELPRETVNRGISLHGKVLEARLERPELLVGAVFDDARFDVKFEVMPVGQRFRCSCGRTGASQAACSHVWAVLEYASHHDRLPEHESVLSSWRGVLTRVEGDAWADARHIPTPWNKHDRILWVLGTRGHLDGEASLTIRWGSRRRTRAGLAPLKRRLVSMEMAPEGLPAADWEALGVLGGLWGPPRPGSYHSDFPSQASIAAPLAPLVLPVFARTGGLVVEGMEERPEPEALTWDARPWRLALAVSERGEQATIEPVVECDGEVRADHVRLVPGLYRIGAALARVDETRGSEWVAGERLSLTLPRADVAEAVGRLAVSHKAPPLLDASLAGWTERAGVPRAVLALEAPGEHAVHGSVLFDYEGARVALDLPGPRTHVADARVIVVRHEDAERARRAELALMGLDAAHGVSVPVDRLPAVVEALVDAGWLVEAERRPVRTGARFVAQVRSGEDWFDLSGNIDFSGARAPLPAALAAARRRSRFVTLDDGSVGLLPEAWLARFRALERAGAAAGDGWRFGCAQHVFLEALLEGLPVEVDAAYERAREALQAFVRVEPLAAPEGFTGTLRPYQEAGVGWMAYLDRFGFGGCLADDMGLGKTVQVLAWLVAARERAGRAPSLVVMPRSLLFNWQDEAARFAPGLAVRLHHGPGRARTAGALAGEGLILTTYGTLRRDAALLRELRFDYLVIDEAQAVKNAGTATAAAIRGLQARRRLALTGTPVENRVGELTGLLALLNPAFEGRLEGVADGRDLDAGAAAALRQAIRPFVLRRTKAAVAADLPPRIEQTVLCELEPAQRELYDGLRDRLRGELLTGQGAGPLAVLEGLLRLRQAACHPGLLDPARRGDAGAKVDALLAAVTEVVAEGHKVLVFSQFTGLLSIVRERLAAADIVHEYLDGAVRDRAARVARFQEDPDCPVFLISLRAGGVGLNLTAADYVYILDPWWNPAVEAQAIDRAHRIGQARAVIAYRLVAAGTVEEKILALQARKRELAEALLGGESGPLERLTREDLEALLASG